jgi:hypothetical protein
MENTVSFEFNTVFDSLQSYFRFTEHALLHEGLLQVELWVRGQLRKKRLIGGLKRKIFV